MITRKSLLVVALTLLLAVSASGCMVGEAMVPQRDVPITMDAAVEGQNMALSGLMSGRVQLTEEQFSSLLTELLKQNGGSDISIDSIVARFDPDKIYLTVNLAQPVGGISTLGVSGNVMVEGNTVKVNLDEAYAGAYMVDPNLMSMISDRINEALANFAVMPVNVQSEEGTLSVSTQAQ